MEREPEHEYDFSKLSELSDDAYNLILKNVGALILTILFSLLMMSEVMNRLMALPCFIILFILACYLYQSFEKLALQFSYKEIMKFQETDYSKYEGYKYKSKQPFIKELKEVDKKIDNRLKIIIRDYYKELYKLRNTLLIGNVFYFCLTIMYLTIF